MNTSFFETVIVSDLFLALRLAARFVGTDKRACLVEPQKKLHLDGYGIFAHQHDSKFFLLRLEPYGLNK